MTRCDGPVLLTGATGFVGMELLARYLERTERPVMTVVRAGSDEDARGRIDAVLGNLFGRLFFILALLFASLPLFAITQYFGGVAGVQIFTSYLIAGCAALGVGAAAIALSVSRLVGRRAVFAFYIAVVSYLAITWAVDAIYSPGAAAGTKVSWMTAINPFLSLRALLDPSNYPCAKEGSQRGLASYDRHDPGRLDRVQPRIQVPQHCLN